MPLCFFCTFAMVIDPSAPRSIRSLLRSLSFMVQLISVILFKGSTLNMHGILKFWPAFTLISSSEICNTNEIFSLFWITLLKRHALHTSPEWNRFVQKTKTFKVIQICKKIRIFISSIQGPSNMIIYRSIIIARKILWFIKDRWNSLFLQKSLFLFSTLYNRLLPRPL